jgi:hypothetical protein
MTDRLYVPVPAITPRIPPLSLLASSITSGTSGDDPVQHFPDGEMLALLPDALEAELKALAGESWVGGFQYAPENHGAAWLRDACDDDDPSTPPLPAPQAPMLVANPAGGTLPAVAHEYQITALNVLGETTPSSFTAHTNVLNDSNTLTWDEVADGIQYNVYGRVAGSIGLLATVGPFAEGQTPTWTDTGAGSPGAAPPVSNTTGGAGIYTNPPMVQYVPFIIEVADTCSAFGWSERDFKGRALRWLDIATPEAIGAEFWTGTWTTARGYPNNFLTNNASVTDLTPGTVPSIVRGLNILQDALANCGMGGQGMIHTLPETTPSLVNARRVGKYLLDTSDNFIVPDPGYTNVGPGNVVPGAGYGWMFATDMVMTRVEEEGTVFPDTFSEALDRGQAGEPNTITFRAERFAAAYFDAQCHFACKVALPS